ncbi:hypothetical protein K439DRAFT_1663706 [Ramaria rubella]|nr:hypothetical protein K439DRAFT_1663706 [Ramaria rubella]
MGARARRTRLVNALQTLLPQIFFFQVPPLGKSKLPFLHATLLLFPLLSNSFTPPVFQEHLSNTSMSGSKHHVNLTHVVLDGFLIILLLLLTISCLIVFRSFIYRRRVQSRVREALASGFIVDDHGNVIGEVPRPKPLGDKPILWEVWVDEKGTNEDELRAVSNNSRDEEKRIETPWLGIQPVSVKILPPSSPMPLNSPSNTSLVPNHVPGSLGQPQPVSSTFAPGKLQVSVLISMPNPNRCFTHGDANDNYVLGARASREIEGDVDVPDVVFGVTNVPMKS